MSTEVEIDDLTDDQLDEVLDQIESSIDSDVVGEEPTAEEEEIVEEAEDDIEDTDTTESDDTEAETEPEEEDTEEVEEEEEDRNAQEVENGNDTEEVEEESETETVEETEAETESEPEAEPEVPEDYRKAKEFYDKVTGEFTANGRKIKGFNDPDKIIQAQQMAVGFAEKMAAIKKYKPFMKTMDELGWTEDSSKFNLVVEASKGNKEAIKKLIEENSIDAMDLDEVEVDKYTPQDHTVDPITLNLEDTLDYAKSVGPEIESKFTEALEKDWAQDNSALELLNDPNKAKGVIAHMSTQGYTGKSIYEEVQERMYQNAVTDPMGYANKTYIDKYDEALQQLATEANRMSAQEAEQERLAKLEEEKQKILNARKEREYKTKASVEKEKIDKAREEATVVSKPKKATKAKPKKEVNLLDLSDDELDDFLATLK